MAVGSLIYRIEYSDHSSLNGKRGGLVILRLRRKSVAKAAAKIDADWLWVQSARTSGRPESIPQWSALWTRSPDHHCLDHLGRADANTNYQTRSGTPTGSFEVRFPDGRPSVYFYWDNIPGRRLRPEQMDSNRSLEAAKALARAERDKK
jgi:hypothetical protein